MEKRNFGSSICTQAAPRPFSRRNVDAMSSLQLRWRSSTATAQSDSDSMSQARWSCAAASFLKLAGNCASSAPSRPDRWSGSIASRNSSTSLRSTVESVLPAAAANRRGWVNFW